MPCKTRRLLPLLLVAASLAPAAHALDLRPDTGSVQLGAGRDGLAALALGVGWDWSWQRPLWGTLVTGHTELFAAGWRARDFGGGHQTFGHFGLLPTLRLRFADGRSPWFAEAGIGVSWTDRRYVTPHKVMGSRFNFTDVIGVGRSFGPAHRQELSLRLQHVSNAGLRDPNPGEDLVLLRYQRRF